MLAFSTPLNINAFSVVIQIHTFRGGSVELVGEIPSVSAESVVWAWNNNKAVEWDKEDKKPYYYPKFGSVSILNMGSPPGLSPSLICNLHLMANMHF